MPIFVTMRVLSGLQGCFFHVAGQTILAEYFPPVQRGTANGFFLAGTVLGPPLGPLIAGIMMTYSSWRSVLWLQVAMIGLAFALALVFVPASRLDAPSFNLNKKGAAAWREFDPRPTFRQMLYPNIIFTVSNMKSRLLKRRSADQAPAAFELWIPELDAIFDTRRTTTHPECQLWFDISAFGRSVLSRAHGRLSCWYRHRWPLFRHDSPQIHSSSR
jgi:MFS family permease